MNVRRMKWQLSALFSLVLLVGCGSAEPDKKGTAPVTGKVTYEGQAVTGGTLLFSPIAEGSSNKSGKTGTATIKSDGTYVMTTYSEGDGAVIGQNRVLFNPPSPQAPSSTDGAHAESKPSPYDGLVAKTAQVSVAKGKNTIDIELVKAPPSDPTQPK